MRPLLLLALIALAACSQADDYRSPHAGEPLSPHMIRLDPEGLDLAQARKDARLALYRGDKALLGTGEMVPALPPGAPAGWREADWRDGVRTIEDTRDNLRDEAHADFYDRARRYAAEYNRTILAAEPTATAPRTSPRPRSPG